MERYFDKNGKEIRAGSFIRLTLNAGSKQVYEYEDEDGNTGLGTDATNPAWIKSGRAVPCEYGIYPLTWEDTETCELCGKDA